MTINIDCSPLVSPDHTASRKERKLLIISSPVWIPPSVSVNELNYIKLKQVPVFHDVLRVYPVFTMRHLSLSIDPKRVLAQETVSQENRFVIK